MSTGENDSDYTDVVADKDYSVRKGDLLIIQKSTRSIVHHVMKPASEAQLSEPASWPKPVSVLKSARKPRATPSDHTEPILAFFRNIDPARSVHIRDVGIAIGTTTGVASHWCSRMTNHGLLHREHRGWFRLAIPAKAPAVAAEWLTMAQQQQH